MTRGRSFIIAAVALVLTATPASATSAASAATATACGEAAYRGQTLRDEHKLVEARDELRACVVRDCPGFVQKDCANWLEEVERRLPSVVLSASDRQGRDLVFVTVKADGVLVTSRLDGQSFPMNPGRHTFVFTTEDGRTATTDVLLAEEAKGRSIAVVLEGDVGGAGALDTGDHSAGATGRPGDAPSNRASRADSRPMPALRVGGYFAGGLGVVGIGIGSALGLMAIQAKNQADCDSNLKNCNPGSRSQVESLSAGSTAAFVGGGVLLAAGITMIVLAPGGPSPPLAVRIAPSLGGSANGLLVSGEF